MNVLILGPNGFVGRHLKARLLRDGHGVIDGTRDYHFIPELTLDEEPISAIINCAGEITHHHHMYASNVALVEKMLRFARDAKISKVIHIGSSSEYGNTDLPRCEGVPCVPTDLYSATKIAATILCEGFARQYDMDVCVARPFSLFGPNDTARKLIPRLIRATAGKDLTPILVTKGGRHDYLYISDFVDGLLKLLHAPKEKTQGDIINFGTGESTSNEEIVVMVGHVRRRTPIHQWVEGGASHDWVADITHARDRYGWTAQTSLESGLYATITSSHE